MLETLFSLVFGLLFKPVHEREQKTFFLKSFIFLMPGISTFTHSTA